VALAANAAADLRSRRIAPGSGAGSIAVPPREPA